MNIERNASTETPNEFDKKEAKEGDVFVDQDNDFWLVYTDQSGNSAELKILLITGGTIEGYELAAGGDHTLRHATARDYVTFRGE